MKPLVYENVDGLKWDEKKTTKMSKQSKDKTLLIILMDIYKMN